MESCFEYIEFKVNDLFSNDDDLRQIDKDIFKSWVGLEKYVPLFFSLPKRPNLNVKSYKEKGNAICTRHDINTDLIHRIYDVDYNTSFINNINLY